MEKKYSSTIVSLNSQLLLFFLWSSKLSKFLRVTRVNLKQISFVINMPFLIILPAGPELVVGRIKTIIKLFSFALKNRI